VTDNPTILCRVRVVFTMQCYACIVYAEAPCPSIHQYIYLSEAGVLPKGLNIGSCKQRGTVAHELWFSDTKDRGGEIVMEVHQTGLPNTCKGKEYNTPVLISLT